MSRVEIPSPNEIMRRRDAEHEQQLQTVIPKIVAELEKRYTGSPVEMSDFHLSQRALERLIAMFSEKGWKVEFQNCTRDGSGLIFRRK